jgi:hypothetical protein
MEGLGTLEALASSEYTNAVDLLGTDERAELMGLLGAMGPRASKSLSSVLKKQIPSKGSRAEMEKFFAELPDHIKKGLLAGKLRFADDVVFSCRLVGGGKKVEMFQSHDIKEKGLVSISAQRLQKNQALLVSGVYLQAGIAATPDTEGIKATKFDSITRIPAIANGQWSLIADKKTLVNEMSNRVFQTEGFTSVPVGYYKLANPRLVHDDVDIEFVVDLGTLSGIDPNTALYVGLHGTVTTP